MKLSDTVHIDAPPETVWRALNDPDLLKAAIPGCKSIEKISDTEFKATAGVTFGPVSATFGGKVTLSDLDPPHGYRISGEGTGGAAGFAKGGATVRLTPKDGGTDLAYDVEASVGGKIAQIGQRFIDQAAKKMADDFFSRFAAAVAPSVTTPTPSEPVIAAPVQEPSVPSAAAPLETPSAAAIPLTPRPDMLVTPDPADDANLRKGLPRKFLVVGAIVIALIVLAIATH